MAEEVLQQEKYIDFRNVKVNDHLVLSITESSKTVDQIKAAEKVGRIILTIFTYAFILALALIVIFPFYWMIITSLKTYAEITQENQTFFPSVVMWSNYVYVFQHFNFFTYMKNTIVVAIFSTIGTLLTTVFAAFAFARLKFKGREALFMVFLATMMSPGEMMVISNYITVASFGWITSSTHTQTITEAYAAMIVPFWVSRFYFLT